ncbi:hypothetical protein [Sinorhizobium meliloti]|uniref:hypothetical protein n=1 Tax=Rhizobium meliloti TaxID=382 RepID=UPI000FDBA765|nr:hypothetical protein [Sinorhizobium meliloti]RVQ01986.1 hypothetical protein CN069_14700 [Sinorhizobium meliloti]
MTAPSETFDLPPELRARANEITGKYRMALAMQMAEEMVDAGVPMNLAFQITVGELAVSAARVAMMACVGLEKREPRRDLWMKRAEENFDEAREWFANLQTEGRIDRCPICAEPFKTDDICATDIELMTCHAACLEGSPVVDLDSGEPLPKGEAHTYRYGDENPPPQANLMGADEIRDLAIRAFNEAIDADGYDDSYGCIEGAIRIALKRNTPQGRLNVETLAQEIVTAACELGEPAVPDHEDTVSISVRDLEAVAHRRITVALEIASRAAISEGN